MRKISFLLLIIFTAAVSLFAALRYRSDVKQYIFAQSQLAVLESKIGSILQAPEEDSGPYSDINMNAACIKGRSYMGIIRFPDIGFSFPVLNRSSGEYFDSGPVLSSGSAKLNDLVISFEGHGLLFNDIKALSAGNSITFTDVDGNVSYYSINKIQRPDAQYSDKLSPEGWDLTFVFHSPGETDCLAFRCTYTI